MSKSKGKPKQAAEPLRGKQLRGAIIPEPGKQVRGLAPQSAENQTIAWQFHRRDLRHAAWGWDRHGEGHLDAVLTQHLHSIETMTWGELSRAAGGRAQGNNSHSIPVDSLCKDAQERLLALNLDDVDELFSLRLTGTIRVWGIRDGRVLKVLWYDPEHTVYPTRR